jgi:CubicO group peptidase (beta-lactamase class C family)
VQHASIVIAVVGAGAAALVWAVRRLRVVAAVGAGYKAKILCTAVFACRREMDPQRADEVFADSYWILRPFRARLDAASESVSASFFGLVPRTAVYRVPYGATLLSADTPLVTLPAGVLADARIVPSGSAPVETTGTMPAAATGEVRDHTGLVRNQMPRPRLTSDRVARVVERAFDEPDQRRLRRTHAVIVIQDDEIVAERYARGVTVDTPLPGWSMTKSVLNALVGLLVVEGRLRLDDRELFASWRLPDPRAAITIEDLLRMRSGLQFSESYSNPWSDVLHMLFTCGDCAAYAASRPLAAPPASVWAYSSGTTNLLSALVRRTVGESEYGSWPRRMLFDRIGMRSAVLEPDASGTFVCSSFMVATARDWARFGQLWLSRGAWERDQILPGWWIDFSTTPTSQSPEGRYGAHWWLKLQPEMGGSGPEASAIPGDAFFAIGHEGQTLTVIPSRRLVVVRMGAAIRVDAWNQASFIAQIHAAL